MCKKETEDFKPFKKLSLKRIDTDEECILGEYNEDDEILYEDEIQEESFFISYTNVDSNQDIEEIYENNFNRYF